MLSEFCTPPRKARMPSAQTSVLLIQQMVTPAMLVLATSSLLNLAYGRIVRVTEAVHRTTGGKDLSTESRNAYVKRLGFARTALQLYFLALLTAGATCLLILVTRYISEDALWLPITLAAVTIALISAATYFLKSEGSVAISQIMDELDESDA